MQRCPSFSGRFSTVSVQASKGSKIANNRPQSEARVSIDHEKLYTESSYQPKREMGPVELGKIPGKGRGLLMRKEVDPGEVILVSSPIVRVTAPPGSNDLQERLVNELRTIKGEMSPADSFRFSVLFDGSPDSMRPLSLEHMIEAEEHVRREAAKTSAAKKGFGAPVASAAAASVSGPHEAVLSDERIQSVTNLNAFGMAHGDLAASRCRGEQMMAFHGIWPEASLINHSCAPNALRVPVGDRILVRATRRLLKAEEVTVSYLGGGLDMAPLQERQGFLNNKYGFKCQCYRCKIEASQPQEVQQKLQGMYEWLANGDRLQRARATITAKDAAAVKVLMSELQQQIDGLEGVLKENSVDSEAQPWLKASAFGMYELLALCRDVGNETRPDQPASLAPFMSLISPGTEAHLFLSLERLLRAAEIERQGPETETAAKACILAHSVRYGMVSDKVLTRIMDVLGSTDYYMGRYTI